MKSNFFPAAFVLVIGLFLTTLSCQDSSSGGLNEASAQAAALGESFFRKVAVDPSGDVYVIGSLSGTGTFDFGNNVRAAGPSTRENAVIVKYDSSGTALWAKTLSSASGDSCFFGIVLDSSANIYVLGYLGGTSPYDFGNGVLATGTSRYTNGIIVQYDSSGTAQWSQTVSSDIFSDTVFYGIDVDQSDNIYVVGTIYGTTFDFGEGVRVEGTNVGENTVIAKYDSSGTVQWAKALSSAPNNACLDVVVGPSGHVYTAGYIEDDIPLEWDNGMTVAGSSLYGNTLIVKYDASGTALWAKSLSSAPSTSSNHFRGITADQSGGIYAVGEIETPGTYDLGDGVRATVSSGDDHTLIVKYNSSGTALWAKTVSTGPSEFSEVTVDRADNIYAAGSMTFDEALDFGNGVTVTGTSGFTNLVIVKYSPSGAALWAKTTSPTSIEKSRRNFSIGESWLIGLTVDNSDNIYAVGSIGSGIIDFGNSVSVTGISSSGNWLIVKYDSSGTALWARTASRP